MQDIIFATKNKGKFTYYNSTFLELGIRLNHVEMDLPEPRSEDLKEIAREKVMSAFKELKQPCIAVDAGFYVNSLNGFPKAFVNFALSTIGVEGILTLVDGKPRQCEFRNCIAYMDARLKEPIFFESGIRGTLSESPRGKLSPIDWSELSLVFMPEGETRTLGEMGVDDRKKLVSQRFGYSYTEVADWLRLRK